MHRLVVAALAAFPLAAFAQDSGGAGTSAETVPADVRGAPAHGQGLYLGAGLGVAGFSDLGGATTAFRLRVGATAPSGVGLGLEALRTFGSNDTITLYDVGVTYASGGNVRVRAAAGLATYRWTGPEAYRADTSDSGFNVLVGVGGGPTVASGLKVTLNLDAGIVRLSRGTSTAMSAWLGLEWL